MSDAPVEFFYDFNSPYGYVAAHKIEAVAAKHGRTVDWKPFLLGAVFKVTGAVPLPHVPMKGDYARHDFARSARFHDVTYNPPADFPFSPVAASRATGGAMLTRSSTRACTTRSSTRPSGRPSSRTWSRGSTPPGPRTEPRHEHP